LGNPESTRERSVSEAVSNPARPVLLTGNAWLSGPWALSSGHLMASLSSKSVKRFWVNFHTKKPTITRTAIPPATDKPTIGPIPIPPEEESLLLEVVGLEEEVGVRLWETMTTDVCVTRELEVVAAAGGALSVGGGWAEDVGLPEEVEMDDSLVVKELLEDDDAGIDDDDSGVEVDRTGVEDPGGP
jgi:hypothetical protein